LPGCRFFIVQISQQMDAGQKLATSILPFSNLTPFHSQSRPRWVVHNPRVLISFFINQV
jgi:hypothetical protein